MNDTLALILQIVVGLVPVIPLVISLVKYVVKAAKEKNWTQMVSLALKLIAEAETLFETGAEKKEYVVKLVMAAAKEINYDIDERALRNLIDSIIDVTKTVNVVEDTTEDESTDKE